MMKMVVMVFSRAVGFEVTSFYIFFSRPFCGQSICVVVTLMRHKASSDHFSRSGTSVGFRPIVCGEGLLSSLICRITPVYRVDGVTLPSSTRYGNPT